MHVADCQWMYGAYYALSLIALELLYSSPSCFICLIDQSYSRSKISWCKFDDMLSLPSQEMAAFLATGIPPKKLGSRHASIAPFEAFPTLDGHVIIAGKGSCR